MSKPYEISSRHRRIAGLMFLVAVSLAVQSALHLSGAIHPTTGSTETRAGIAEAVICVALLWGSSTLAWRGHPSADAGQAPRQGHQPARH